MILKLWDHFVGAFIAGAIVWTVFTFSYALWGDTNNTVFLIKIALQMWVAVAVMYVVDKVIGND